MKFVRYIDCHSHLHFSQFDADRAGIIAAMEREGIATITVGTNLQTSREALALAEQYPHLFATVGMHPTEAAGRFDATAYEELVREKVVGVGECGLDYYRIKKDESGAKQTQGAVFKQQIEFALKHDLPLMIHARPTAGSMGAYKDVLDILGSYSASHHATLHGNVHFFAGNKEMAEGFLELGFTLSFDGPITFARDYDDVIRFVPRDMLLAETDAPFAAPEPYRGTRNSPFYVKEVVRALAKIRGEDEDTIRCATVENTLRVFPRLAAMLR